MLDVNNSLEFGGTVPDVIKFKFLIAVSLINLLTNSLISNPFASKFDKKLESLAYDTTDICTITDNSESKNGKYRVTDGSVSYIAYSDTDNFKVGDQVRVNIPNNDYTQ